MSRKLRCQMVKRKSDKCIGQAINRLRAAANSMDKEAEAIGLEPPEFPGFEETTAGKARVLNMERLKLQAYLLRGMANSIDSWPRSYSANG